MNWIVFVLAACAMDGDCKIVQSRTVLVPPVFEALLMEQCKADEECRSPRPGFIVRRLMVPATTLQAPAKPGET
jgi:hypothetical protein